MRDKPYALSAALQAREHDKALARALVDAERARLGESARALSEAQHAVLALTQARRARAGRPAHTGAQLSRLGAEASRAALQHAELVRKEAAAKLAHATQQRRVRAAEAVLANAFAEHAVIERHHAQFREGLLREARNAASDEQDDVLSARARSRAPR